MRKFKSVLTVVLFVLVLTGCGLKVDPSLELGVRLGLGETCLENHNYQQAENEFKAALNVLEKDPEHLKSDEAEVWTRLGQTYKRLGKHDSAKAALQKGCELYEEADDMFLFTMDKRIWAQCLAEYKPYLEKDGKKDEAKEVGDTLSELREELGPVEALRSKMKEF